MDLLCLLLLHMSNTNFDKVNVSYRAAVLFLVSVCLVALLLSLAVLVLVARLPLLVTAALLAAPLLALLFLPLPHAKALHRDAQRLLTGVQGTRRSVLPDAQTLARVLLGF